MSDLYGGHSEMFFLQRDFGELRTICDGSRQCIFWVRSGSHYNFETSLSLAYDIARVFLTRGDDASDEQMFDAIYHVEQRWGSEPVYRAMENLAKTDKSPAVRARALQRLATLRRQLPDG
jgi:trehalose-6-phosphatase